ncbi:MAG: hydroxypyruvate isomerase [Acidobacteriales bacterium 59-55]|nr:MAG: hydroxypyruvate isomerase [Acidobacteriales bacterium 59-55]
MTRRVFGKWMAAGLGASALAPEKFLMAQPSASDAAGLQFSVMMWTLKSHGTFEENLERIAQAGYRHVELVGEFKKWSEADWQRILARMKALGVTVDATTGVAQGFADPAGGDTFISELKEFIPIAHRLQARQLILVSGKRIEGAAPGSQHQASIDTLKRSVEILSAAGLVAVIEPIDRLENPPIYLDGVTEGFEIVRAVGSPHVKVLYDFYHEQRTHGDLIEKLEKNFDEVGLVHIADVPGRHEPGTGEVNYINIYRKLKQLKYKGVIAMEFYPTGDVVQTLRHAREEAMQA